MEVDLVRACTCIGAIVGGICGFLLFGLIGGYILVKKRKIQVVDASGDGKPALYDTTAYLVADSVFEEVGGTASEPISLAKLSKFLIKRGDVSMAEVQELFDALDTNGMGITPTLNSRP